MEIYVWTYLSIYVSGGNTWQTNDIVQIICTVIRFYCLEKKNQKMLIFSPAAEFL